MKIDKKTSEFSIFSKKDEAKKEEIKQNEKGDSELKEEYDDIEKILNNSEIDKEQLKKRVKIYVNNISEKQESSPQRRIYVADKYILQFLPSSPHMHIISPHQHRHFRSSVAYFVVEELYYISIKSTCILYYIERYTYP